MIVRNPLKFKKHTSKIFDDYFLLKSIVEIDRPFYLCVDFHTPTFYKGVEIKDEIIKIIDTEEKEKLILLVAMFFYLNTRIDESRDFENTNENGIYITNSYNIQQFNYIKPIEFKNKFLEIGDYIDRCVKLKLFLENILPSLKDNFKWKYIKTIRLENSNDLDIVDISIPVKEGNYFYINQN